MLLRPLNTDHFFNACTHKVAGACLNDKDIAIAACQTRKLVIPIAISAVILCPIEIVARLVESVALLLINLVAMVVSSNRKEKAANFLECVVTLIKSSLELIASPILCIIALVKVIAGILCNTESFLKDYSTKFEIEWDLYTFRSTSPYHYMDERLARSALNQLKNNISLSLNSKDQLHLLSKYKPAEKQAMRDLERPLLIFKVTDVCVRAVWDLLKFDQENAS